MRVKIEILSKFEIFLNSRKLIGYARSRFVTKEK